MSWPAWRQAVRADLEVAYRHQQAELPAAIQEMERALAAVEEKIRRLVDQIESGLQDPDVMQRLAQRRAEKQALQQQLERARRALAAALPPPTEEWVEQQLRDLQSLLAAGGPAATHELRRLQEIAQRLGCCRDTVTEAIAHWFQSRGLEVPDGRTRRKQLPRKCSRKDPTESPVDDPGDIDAARSHTGAIDNPAGPQRPARFVAAIY